MGGNNEFFENFERNKYLKNYPACKELNKLQGHSLTHQWQRMFNLHLSGENSTEIIHI